MINGITRVAVVVIRCPGHGYKKKTTGHTKTKGHTEVKKDGKGKQ
jgi:hypothetical protein